MLKATKWLILIFYGDSTEGKWLWLTLLPKVRTLSMLSSFTQEFLPSYRPPYLTRCLLPSPEGSPISVGSVGPQPLAELTKKSKEVALAKPNYNI